MTASGQDTLSLLRRPFTPQAIRFKIQSTYDNPQGGGKAMCVGYIDARLVVERLNLVVGLAWHDEYEQVDQLTLLCRLTVQGVTRCDVGVIEKSAAGGLKAVYSDALKRAAVRFGVGVSVYAMEKQWVDYSDCKVRSDGKAVGLKPSGEALLRARYAKWLEYEDIKEWFGEPIAHGDTEDAQGEPDVDQPVDVPPEAPPEAPETQPGPPPARRTSRSSSGSSGTRGRSRTAKPDPDHGDAPTQGPPAEPKQQPEAAGPEPIGPAAREEAAAAAPAQAKTSAEVAAQPVAWTEEKLRTEVPLLPKEVRQRLKWYCGFLGVQFQYAEIAERLGPAESAAALVEHLDSDFRNQYDLAHAAA